MSKQSQARKALRKGLNQVLSPNGQLIAEYAPDVETDQYYTWHLKANGLKIELIYSYKTKTVTTVSQPIRLRSGSGG